MNNKKDQVVHESETHRQYIRIQLPAEVVVSGARYHVKDLSSGGLAIRNFDPPPKKNQIFDLKLILPFQDFSCDINIKAEVVYIDKKEKVIGCRFTDISENQASILSYVIKSFISGNVVEGQDVLNIVSRDSFAKMRKEKNEPANPERFLKSLTIYLVIALATIALGFFIFKNIYKNLYILSASNAHVAADTIDLQAPSTGFYKSSLADSQLSVSKNQIIGRIYKTDAVGLDTRGTPVISPCDCFLMSKEMITGRFFQQGQTLSTLLPKGASPFILVHVPSSEIHKIKTGTHADVSITGTGLNVSGYVEDIRSFKLPIHAGASSPQMNEVTIKPEKPFSLDHIGRPAYVEFNLLEQNNASKS